jgi:hypothetical protein
VVETPQPIAAAAVLPALPIGIGFHNSNAVRVGFVVALIAWLVGQIPLPVAIALIWHFLLLLAAGFGAAVLYSRRTGEMLTLRGGARMGWITGVFYFLIATIVITLSILIMSSENGLQELRDKVAQQAGNDPNMEQAMQLLQSPAGLGLMMIAVLAILFVMFTVLPSVGGALAAKVLEKE